MGLLPLSRVYKNTSRSALDIVRNHYAVREISLGRRNEGYEAVKQKIRLNPKADPSLHYTTVSESNWKECKRDNYLHSEPCLLDPCIKQPRVLIIGAGIAGLACANKLFQCGFNNFMVLEASEKPGGRIQTCWVNKDTMIEFGPLWVQGAGPANPVYGLAARAGLLKEPLTMRAPQDPHNALFVKSEGKPVDRTTTIIGTQVYEQIEGQAKDLFLMSLGKGHGTLYHFLDKRIREELKAFPEHQKRDLKAVMYGNLNRIRTRWGADPKDMSASEFGAYESVPGPSVRVSRGTVVALSPLVNGIPKDLILYHSSVKSINWDTRQVEVCTHSGSRYKADHVVVTLPLGVLKAEHECMFCPKLPEQKVRAIRCLGYGLSNRIYLKYDRPFWSPGSSINFAWTDEELLDKCSWVKGISRLEEVPDSDDTLTATISGLPGSQIEEIDECEIASEITSLLKRSLRMSSLPFPMNVVRTQWSKISHFLGTNSFMGIDSKASMICDLSQPVARKKDNPPSLMFAGEATADTYFSTMQGAYFSGVREAGRIIDIASKAKH